MLWINVTFVCNNCIFVKFSSELKYKWLMRRYVSYYILNFFICEIVIWMWTAYKQSLTPAREFDRVPIRPYWPSRKWKPRIWHTIFICPAFENPYWFLFNVNLLLFIVRYVIITVIFLSIWRSAALRREHEWYM